MGNVYEWTVDQGQLLSRQCEKVEGEQHNWYVIRGASFGTDAGTEANLGHATRLGFDGNTKVGVLGLSSGAPAVKVLGTHASGVLPAGRVRTARTYLSLATSPSIITRKNPETLSLNNHEQTLDCVFKNEN